MTAEDKDGSTPLHLAAAQGRVEVVKYLIATGAYVDVRCVQVIYQVSPLRDHPCKRPPRIQDQLCWSQMCICPI